MARISFRRIFSRPSGSASAAIFAIAAFGGLPTAEAVQRGCSTVMEAYLSPGQDLHRLDVKLYAEAEAVLFLSDGWDNSRHWSLGKKVSTAYPAKRVVSADYNYQGPAKVGNLELLSMDNTQRFPFASDSFDMVVLRRGLCICGGRSTCCGGFFPLTGQAKEFFREAVRVMNKRNPKARVILHGSHGVTPNVVRAWQGFLESIERETGVQATLYFNSWDSFVMIGITP